MRIIEQSASNRLLGAIIGMVIPMVDWAISRNLADHFTVVKWGVVYAGALATLLVISLSEIAVRIPKVPRWVTLALLVLCISLVAFYAMTKGWVFSKALVDRLSITCLAVASFTYISGTSGRGSSSTVGKFFSSPDLRFSLNL